MSEIRKVIVGREANVYFGGGVTDRTLVMGDRTRQSLRIMQPETYEFGAEAPERKEILPGDLEGQLRGEGVWGAVGDGDALRVPGGTTSGVKVYASTGYACTYLPEASEP